MVHLGRRRDGLSVVVWDFVLLSDSGIIWCGEVGLCLAVRGAKFLVRTSGSCTWGGPGENLEEVGGCWKKKSPSVRWCEAGFRHWRVKGGRSSFTKYKPRR